MYSCFRAFNDTVLQTFLRNYTGTLGHGRGVTYLATLTLICAAVYVYRRSTLKRLNLLPSGPMRRLCRSQCAAYRFDERLRQILKAPTGGKILSALIVTFEFWLPALLGVLLCRRDANRDQNTQRQFRTASSTAMQHVANLPQIKQAIERAV